jgi:hypothetical protein
MPARANLQNAFRIAASSERPDRIQKFDTISDCAYNK